MEACIVRDRPSATSESSQNYQLTQYSHLDRDSLDLLLDVIGRVRGETCGTMGRHSCGNGVWGRREGGQVKGREEEKREPRPSLATRYMPFPTSPTLEVDRLIGE